MLRRKGVFTARITVPADVREHIGRSELWRSTLTDDPREAKLRDALWQGHFGSLFAHLRGNARRMDREQIETLVTEYLNTRLDEVEERIALDLDEFVRHEWEDKASGLAFATALALSKGDLSDTLGAARGMLPDAPEVAVRVLARRLLEAKLHALTAELGALAGEPLARPSVALKVPQRQPAVNASGPLLSAVCREYIDTRSVAASWSLKTRNRAESSLKLLLDLVPDKAVSVVTKAEMSAAWLDLLRIPANRTKRYPGKTAREAIEAADAAQDSARLEPKTANLRLEVWKSVFKWAVGMDHIERSPAEHLTRFAMEAAQDQRAAFTDDELRLYFARLKRDKKHPAHRMIALLMPYAGLRLEEAAALRACDVRIEQGVSAVDVTPEAGNLKTANARRLVPLHSAIVGEVTAWARRRETEGGPKVNLWGFERASDGRLSSALSKRLNRRLALAGIKRDGLVAYSLRHTFATRLKSADVQEHVISELMGHAVESLSVGRYGKKLDVQRLREAVEKLRLAP